MIALSKITDPQEFFYEAVHQKAPVTLRGLLQEAIDNKYQSPAAFMGALNEKVEGRNLILGFKEHAPLATVTEANLQKWIKTCAIPNEYFPLASELLGKRDDKCFAACFSPEARGDYFRKLLRRVYIAHKGDYADFFAFAVMMQNAPIAELPRRLGLYESTVDGVAEGKILLSPRLLELVDDGLLQKFLPAAARPDVKKLLAQMVESERAKFEKKASPEKAFAAKIMGDVDMDTTLGTILSHIGDDKESPFVIARVAHGFDNKDVYHIKENGSDHHMDLSAVMLEKAAAMAKVFMPNAYCERLFNDVATQNRPHLGFEQILTQYLKEPKPGEEKPSRTAQGFIKLVEKELNLTQEALAEHWNLSPQTLNGFGAPGQTASIEEVIKQESLADPQKQLDLYALLRGSQPYVSIDTLCNQTEEILRYAQQKYQELPPTISSDNRVYQKMVERNLTPPEGPVDAAKAGCSLCEILCESRGLTDVQIEERGGYDRSRAPESTLPQIWSGKNTVTLRIGKVNTEEHPADALRMAQAFASDGALQERMGLLFQDILKKQTPEELLGEIKNGTLTAGRAVRQHRRQSFMSMDDFLEAIAAKGCEITKQTLHNLETGQTTFGEQRNAAGAQKDAEAIASVMGFKPKSIDMEVYARYLQDRAISTRSHEELEQMVEAATEPGSPTQFKDLIDPFGEYLGVRSNLEYAAKLILPGTTETVTGPTIQSWRDGKHPKAHQQKTVEALADALKFKGTIRSKLIQLGMGKLPHYDPSIVESLPENATAAERTAAMKALRENAKLTHEQMGQAIREGLDKTELEPVGSKRYSILLEQRGATIQEGISDVARERDEAVINIFSQRTIPPSHNHHRQKLRQVLSSPLQTATSQGHADGIESRRTAGGLPDLP